MFFGSLIYLLFGLIDLIIGLRFVFLLLGVNSMSQIVSWIYSWSNHLVAPFDGIFGQHSVTTGPGVVTHGVFDWTALIALVVYGLVGGILGQVFDRYRPR